MRTQVCLSLLGTWEGPGWDPKTSTLTQVLLSIASLILVEVCSDALISAHVVFVGCS